MTTLCYSASAALDESARWTLLLYDELPGSRSAFFENKTYSTNEKAHLFHIFSLMT